MPSLPGLYALWAWLFVVLGLALAVLGPSLPEVRADFAVTLAGSGLVFTVHSAGYLGGVFAAGPLADARGRKLVTGAGVAGLGGGMALAAIAPNWPALLATMLLAGAGFAFVDVGLNAAIGDAAAGPGRQVARRAVAMNLLHAAFPIGTLVAPAGLAAALRSGLGWRVAFAATALAAAGSAIGLVAHGQAWPGLRGSRVKGQGSRGRQHASSHDEADRLGAASKGVTVVVAAAEATQGVWRLLREPYLRKLAAIQALYVGAEVGIAGWVATYLVEQFGADASAGAIATSAYWAGFVVGRPLVAYLTHRCGPQRVLPWLFAGGLIGGAAGAAAPTAPAAAVAYALTGLAICGVFPTVMALALEGRGGDEGAATALITGAAAVGGLTWPWLIGAVAQATGLRAAMAVAAAPLLAMLVLARGTTGLLPGRAQHVEHGGAESGAQHTGRVSRRHAAGL